MKIRADVTSTGSLPLTVDAKGIVSEVTRAHADYLAAHVRASTDPITGAPRRDLEPKAANKPGRKGGRGYDTGLLATMPSRVGGGHFAATGKITVPSERRNYVFIAASRGETYLTTDGLAGLALERELAEAVDREIDR